MTATPAALTAEEAALLATVTAKPVILRRMSDAARAPEAFRLGLADDMARRGLISKDWDTARNGFVYAAPIAEEQNR